MSGTAELRIDEDLRFLLSPRRRSGVVTVPIDGTSTIGHLVQSVGIPLTEVGSMRLGDRSAAASHRAEPADVVVVSPIPRPQVLPSGPRFLLDVHLGSLARRMRLLGIDTVYHPDADDDLLAAAALDGSRMLLTQDRGLLRRTALRETAAFVRGRGADEQLRDVLQRFEPPLAPYTRCLRCNEVLHRVAKQDVVRLLMPGTRRSYDEFTRCSGCGRVYWKGAHAQRLATLVAGSGSGAVESSSRASGPDGTKVPGKGEGEEAP